MGVGGAERFASGQISSTSGCGVPGSTARIRRRLLCTTALVAVSVALLATSGTALAQTQVWTGAVDNSYNNAGNWSGAGAPPDAAGERAQFDATGAAQSSVTVTGTVSPDSWAITGNPGVNYSISGGTVNFQDAAGLTNSSTSGAHTVDTLLGGVGGITQNGAGSSLTVSNGGNNFTGPISVSAGTLNFSATGAMGSALGSVSVSGGTLGLGSTTHTKASLTQSGGIVQSGTLTVGPYQLTGGTLASTATINATSFDMQSGTVDGVLAGTGGVTKTTGGIVTFSGANTYSGNTVITAGTLALSGAGTLGNVANSTNINGATAVLELGGTTQTQNGGVTLQNGGTIQNGSLNSSTGLSSSGGNINALGGTTTVTTTANTTTISGTNTYSGPTTVNGGSTLVLSTGGSITSFVGNSGTFNNDGTVNNAVTNGNTFNNNVTGIVTGLLTNTAGTTTNNGQLNNGANVTGGTLTNNKTITGAVTNAATFNNNSAGTVSGLLTNTAGTTTNAGALNGGVNVTGGTFTQNAGSVAGGLTNTAIVNANGGAINGAINNNAPGQFNVNGGVSSNGLFTNANGAALNINAGGNLVLTPNGLTNSGSVTVSNFGQLTSAVTNNSTGQIVVGARGVVNGNLLNNTNTSATAIQNTGTWIGDATNAGGITNTGTWTTVLSGFTNNAGGTLTQTAGTINAAAGGFKNTGGTVNASGGAINGAITNTNVFNVTNTVTSNSTFANNGPGGKLNVGVGGTTGTYTVDGLVTNSGTITVAANSTLTAAAGITNQTGGQITNFGTVNDALNNAGTVDNNGTYNANVATNTGTINNNTGATWNGNVLSNTATINNKIGANWNGSLTTSGGVVTNSGVWTGNATVQAGGTLNNNFIWNGNVNNAGTFANNGPNGTVLLGLTNAATATNSGTINNGVGNSGSFTNTGTVTGGLTNAAGTTNNNGSGIINGGATVTGGTVNNNNTAQINGGANVSGGTLNNNNTATIAGTVTVSGTGTVNNNATVTGAVNNANIFNNNNGGTVSGLLSNTAGTSTNNTGGTLNGGVNVSGGNFNNAGGTVNNGLTQTAGNSTNSGTLNGGANVSGGTLTTTNRINGGLTTSNTGTGVFASGIINGPISIGGTVFRVTGALTGNNSVTLNNSAVLDFGNPSVAGRSFTGITTLTNNSNAAVGINIGAGDTLGVNAAVNNAGASIADAGTFNIATTLTNAGGITVLSGGILTAPGGTTNTGTITVLAGGTVTDVLNNSGTVNNAGTYNADVNNLAPGTITNQTGGIWNGNMLSNTGTVTNQTGAQWNGNWTTAGSATNAGTVTGGVTNSGTLGNSGTIGSGLTNLAGTTTNSGTINGGATITGGTLTTTGTVAGLLTNSGTVNASGTVNGAIVNNSAFNVTGALSSSSTFTNNGGGTLTLNSNAGTYTVAGLVTNSGNIVVNSGATLDASAGGLTNLATGTVTVKVGGTVKDDLNNAGVVDNSGTYVARVASNNGPSVSINAVINNNVGATWTGDVGGVGLLGNGPFGTINNAGTWTTTSAGFFTAGTLVTTGLLDATAGGLTNSGTVRAEGTIRGNINNNAGTFTLTNNLAGNGTFTNAPGATLDLKTFGFTGLSAVSNTGTSTLTPGTILFGSNAVLGSTVVNNNNFGTINVASTGTINGTLNNNAGGVVNMQDGNVTGRLNATNYVGQSGSSVRSDIDLSKISGTRADVVATTGANGATTINFSQVSQNPTFFATPIPVLTTATTGTPIVVTQTGLPADNPARIANYSLQKDVGGVPGWSVVSTLNTGVVTSTVTGILASIASIDASFHQPASALVASVSGTDPNKWSGGPWVRVSGGRNDITSTGTIVSGAPAGTPASSRIETVFQGIQGGFDSGVLNVGNSMWNVHVGLTGGEIAANSTETLAPAGGSLNFRVPFVGLYLVATRGGFFADVTVRRDFFDLGATSTVVSAGATGTSNTVNGGAVPFRGTGANINGSAGYHADLGNNYFAEVSGGLSWSRASFDSIPLVGSTPGNNNMLTFDTVQSLLGRVGVRFGTTINVADKVNLGPFVSFSAWNEFEKGAGANAILGGSVIGLSTTRVGTFYQASGGMSFQVPNTGFLGFVRGDMRFGENIEGWTALGGLRYTFGPY
jgi:hypothetical protein